MGKKLLLNLSLFLFSAVILTGCGQTQEEKELAEFSASMTSFTNNVASINEEINGLDVTNTESVEDLLTLLDRLSFEFENLSEVPVPDQYQSISDLASEADENMSNAVNYYHQAFEASPFDSTAADIGYQYYLRSMTRLKYIGYVLADEIPEDENVTVEEETNDSLLIEKLLEKSSGQITTGEILDDIGNLINKD